MSTPKTTTTMAAFETHEERWFSAGTTPRRERRGTPSAPPPAMGIGDAVADRWFK